MVGDKCKLLVPMLGNPEGTIGYVYEIYPDFDHPALDGISVIFENGKYDGFSAWDQEHYLEYIGHCGRYEDYVFENVGKLIDDFRRGYWKFGG
jgi:hypothetical protein